MIDQKRAVEVIRAELELLGELLAAMERGQDVRILEGLPLDDVDGPRELAKRIREGDYRLVLR